ncbi:MAG TPA: hypothetical protein VIM11_26115 [Tepidisphaeraceae bacterium]
MMNESYVTRSLRYGAAAAAVIGAFVLTDVFRRVGNPGSFPLFIAAVLLSAWYGGFGPGAFAMVLSGIAGVKLLEMRPGGTDPALPLAIFTSVSILAVVLGSVARRATLATGSSLVPAERDNVPAKASAALSEQLRWPNDPLLILVQMLRGKPFLPSIARAERREFRKKADVEAHLLDDVSNSGTVNTETPFFGKYPVNLHESLQEAAQACEPELMNKQIELDVHFAASNSHVLADANRLEQLFRNLIHSATQFVPVGGSISVRTSNAPDERVRVDVGGRRMSRDTARLTAGTALPAVDQRLQFSARSDGLDSEPSPFDGLQEGHDDIFSAFAMEQKIGAMFSVSLPAHRVAEKKRYIGRKHT